MTQALAVRQFTCESNSGIEFPNIPQKMSKEQVIFITRMILSELDELVCTVSENEQEKEKIMSHCFETRDKCNKYTFNTDTELIACQYDALVDSHYYALNCAAKHGVNLDKIFEIVHDANMAKKDPITKKFIKRDDGKIIKPEGWKEPNIELEIKRQIKENAF